MADTSSGSTPHYRFAIRRPVSTAMLFLTLIVFGWRSYQQLPVNLMPDISYPSLTVRTEYEGAAPEDVEMLVTRPLEELLSIVSSMVEISSVSSPGLSEITLEFDWSADIASAQQEVRDRLDLFMPPQELTQKPVILRYDPSLDPVMRVAIVSEDEKHVPGSQEERDALTTIREAAERRLKSDLEAEDGIAQAKVKGGQKEEIQVQLDVENLKSLGLSPEYVITALAQQNINLSGGRLREGEAEYLVRTLNEFMTIEDVANSIILTPGGAHLKLIEIAEVFLGTKERETIVHINGREAVAIDIYKEGDANTVNVCNRVHDLLGFEREYSFQEKLSAAIKEAAMRRQAEKLAASGTVVPAPVAAKPQTGAFLDRLPKYAKPAIISDQSRFIRGAIKEVQQSALIGGLLALLVLYVFLQEMRSTVIIGISIPISVITAFVPMFFQKISLNIMSLGGLALGVGMLVDNSIVVLESVFRCREEGDSLVDAAERGTKEVAAAVTSSTLTTICVFLPVAFVEGIAGQLFGNLSLTVTYSLLASLLTALYLIPLIVSRQGQELRADRYVIWLVRAYQEGRATVGESKSRAFFSVLPRGIRYAGTYIRTVWRESLEVAFKVFGSALRPPLWKNLPHAVFYVVLLPFLLALFLLRLLSGTVISLLVTGLYLICVFFYGIFRIIRGIFGFVFYIPLKSFALGFEAFRKAYGATLRAFLRFSPAFLLGVVLLSIHAGYLALELGRELMPPMRQGEFGLRVEVQTGTRLEKTEEQMRQFEEILRSTPEVASVTLEVGAERDTASSDKGDNIATFTVLLKEASEMEFNQDEVIERLRENIFAKTTTETVTFTLPTMFSFRNAIETQLFGDVLKDLREYGDKAVALISTVAGVKDAEQSIKPGYPELIIEMDRQALAARGLSPGKVAQRLRTEIQGEVATRFSRGSDKLDIRVRASQKKLSSVEDLRFLSVTDGPAPIPLINVAKLRIEEGPSEIRRVNQKRTVILSANVEGRDLGAVSRDIDSTLEKMALPQNMYFLQGGQSRELDAAFKSLRFVLLLAAFLVYVVMACQFESIIQPALVMFSVPLAFIGVVYTLYLTGTNLNVMVFLGGIVLIGIVVNNAIILVDYTNQLQARGLNITDAIVEAGVARIRPIFMTTITTVLGLTPMLIASGEGAEMRRPMALTLIAGLSFSTLLTLFIIPMAYYLFGRKKSL